MPLPQVVEVPSSGQDVRVGDAISLAAAVAPREPVVRGDGVTVRLYWRALSRPTGDATVFVHLLSQDGRLVAQRDSPPAGGRRPTSWWLPGEVLADQYRLDLTEVEPGSYQIEVGMYDPVTGARLPLTVGGVRQPGDRWLLPDKIVVR